MGRPVVKREFQWGDHTDRGLKSRLATPVGVSTDSVRLCECERPPKRNPEEKEIFCLLAKGPLRVEGRK